MEKKKAGKKAVVELQPIEILEIEIPVKGDTDLLMEKMDKTVAARYDDKKSGKIVKKDTRSEEDKVPDKIHYTEDGNIGFPSSGFLKGMAEVAPYLDGLDKKKVKGSVRMVENIVPISFDKQMINEAVGVDSGRTRAPRKILRPQFHGWKAVLKIRYNKANISAEQLVNLVNWAGFQQGVGAWRPEKGGVFGQYHVVRGK